MPDRFAFLPSMRPLLSLPRAAGLGAAAVLLAGCAHSPQPAADDLGSLQLPAQWSTQLEPNAHSAQPSNLHHWWEHFGDERLNALIAQARANSPTVLSAVSALEQSRAQLDAQSAGLIPNVGANANASRSDNSGSRASSRFGAGLDASWEIDLWGRKAAGVEAAQASVDAAAASLDDAHLSLAADVALNYVQLRSLAQRLHIAHINEQMQRQTAQIVAWRAQSGLASSLDAQLALQNVEQLAAQMPALRASFTQNLHALAVLLGQPPQALLAEFAPIAQWPQTPDTSLGPKSLGSAPSAGFMSTLAHLRQQLQALPSVPQIAERHQHLIPSMPAAVIAQRADIRARQHRVRAALQSLSAQEVAHLPTARISASASLGALTLGALLNGASVGTNLAASLAASLFDGGAQKAQVRSQLQAVEQSRLALRSGVLAALKEVEDALVQLQADRQRLTHLQAVHTSSHNAAVLALHRYESGLTDLQTVLDTQRSAFSADDALAQAQASISSDLIRLYKALGAGINP